MTNMCTLMCLLAFIGPLHGAAYSAQEFEQYAQTPQEKALSQRLILLCYSIDVGRISHEKIIGKGKRRAAHSEARRKYCCLLKGMKDLPLLEGLAGSSSFGEQSAKVLGWLQAFPDTIAVRNQLYYSLRLRDLSQEGREFEVPDGQLHKIECNPFVLQYFCEKQKTWRFLNYEVPSGSLADYDGWGIVCPFVGRKIEQMNITYGGTRADGSCKKIRFRIKCKDELFPKLGNEIYDDLRLVKDE